MTDAPHPFPIIVGVAGHGDILPAAEPAVRAAVVALLTAMKGRFGDALHVLTALADGADQLVADVASELSIAIIAVAPMPLAACRARVTDVAGLDRHWSNSVLRFELPAPCVSGATPEDEEALIFEQLGVLISRRSHLLLALWDGLEPEGSLKRRRAGAGAVVRMRRHGEDHLQGFRDSRLFPNGVSRLELSRGGPVAQIVTPCAHTDGALPAGAAAGDCLILPDDVDVEAGRSKMIKPGEIWHGLDEAARQDFGNVQKLSKDIEGFNRHDRRLFIEQVGYLSPKDVLAPTGYAGECVDRLRRWQAAADVAAQNLQRRLHGDLTPAQSMWQVGGKAIVAFLRVFKGGRFPNPGIVFMFAILAPTAVFLFEAYAHLKTFWALRAYLGILLVGFLIYDRVVKAQAWQSRFQDYRALAEAMRVQMFWAAAATPEAVSDSYLRKQRGELGWIQFALRGPALWSSAAALTLARPCRDFVMTGWVEDQLNYFGEPGSRKGKTALNAAAAERSRFWAVGCLSLGLVATLLLFLKEEAHFTALDRFVIAPAGEDKIDYIRGCFLTFGATLSALAAFFTLWVDQRAYEAQADSYGLMGRLFHRARRVALHADDGPAGDESFQAVVRDLGREALAENAEWLVDHRRRKIEQKGPG